MTALLRRRQNLQLDKQCTTGLVYQSMQANSSTMMVRCGADCHRDNMHLSSFIKTKLQVTLQHRGSVGNL